MNTCFDCGGKLKLIAKPGRLAFDDIDENEYYEIPAELKISTCLDCGEPNIDNFVKMKIDHSIESQKKVKPSTKLLQLRYINNKLEDLLYRYKEDYLQYLIVNLLEFREIIISKGTCSSSKEINNALKAFMKSHNNNDINDTLGAFCDVWINT